MQFSDISGIKPLGELIYMKTTHYNKLVRDLIPVIIAASGKECITETLSHKDYITLLDAKLNEELAEYQESKSLEEFADLLEVMMAVVTAKGFTWDDLEQLRINKAEKRGALHKKVLLKKVEEG